jgi:hypothetical protein
VSGLITKCGCKFTISTIHPYGNRNKCFLDLHFGIAAGTAFGVTNKIKIPKIDSIIAKNIHRKDMMVDVQQLHENHLYKLDQKIKNTGTILHQFLQYSPASSYLDNMIASIQWVQSIIETGLEQAQNKKLSHTLFPNDVSEKIYQMAQNNG